MIKSVITFGGSGFIGFHLHRYFKNMDTDKINLDIKSPYKNQFYNYLNIDVRKKIDYELESDGDSVIYNLAAIHKTPGHPDYEYFETNILGAENVCDFARNNNINTIVFTSSIAPYGASEELKCEDTLPTPNTPYGISKLVAEEIHKRWQAGKPYKRKLIILRPGVVFGKYEKGNFTRLYQSLKKRLFYYPGRKDTRKAAVYVKDLVRLMAAMAENEPPGTHLYNMCYPEPHTIQEIVETMCDVTGLKAPKMKIPPFILDTIASILKKYSSLTGNNLLGIHPERIKKLMISTNISGEKLANHGYDLEYDLSSAIEDWYQDCNRNGLF